uniref:Zinc finger and BTB domain-containing protein 49-like n=1 Tax=Phallusia mammillata TaxID=59560 RepID=A0A6F9DWP1_9ASCI|nr:zinc finger and BTB domain-containing protein 49-like [Phallusia mammillata]
MENSIYLKSIPLVFEDHGDKLLKALYDQQKKSQLCDVSLVVENVSFPAHKAVLAAHSSYFQALFDRGKLNDDAGSKACNVTTIHLSSISANTFIPILHFLYTSRLHVFCENVRDLLRTARKLQISSIVQACEHLMAENVTLPSVSEVRHCVPKDLTSVSDQQTQSVLYVDLKSEDDDDFNVASSGRNLLELHSDFQDPTAALPFLSDESNETKVRGGRTHKKGFPKKIQQPMSTSGSISMNLPSVQNISTIAPASIFGRTQASRSRLPLSPMFSITSTENSASKPSFTNPFSTESLSFANNLESLGNVFANESANLMMDSFQTVESSFNLCDKNNSPPKTSTNKNPDSLQVQSVYSMSPKLPNNQSPTVASSKKTKSLQSAKVVLGSKTNSLSNNYNGDVDIAATATTIVTSDCETLNPSVYTCKDCCKYFTNVTEAVNHYYSEHPVSSTPVKPVSSRPTHAPDRNSHSCPHCGRLFNNKNNLKRHILIKHTTDKRFKCSICGRRYAIRQSLQYHMRSIHGKETEVEKPSVTSPTISSSNPTLQYEGIGHLITSSTDQSELNMHPAKKSPAHEKRLSKLSTADDFSAITSTTSYMADASMLENVDKSELQPSVSGEDLPSIQRIESIQNNSSQNITSKLGVENETNVIGSESRLVKAEPHATIPSSLHAKDSTAFPGCVNAVTSLSSPDQNCGGVMLPQTVASIEQVDLSVESLSVPAGGNPFVLSGTSQLPALLPVFSGEFRRTSNNDLPMSQSRVGSRLHRCDTCDRAFSTIQAYTRHRRSCNKHECPICHRGFSQMGNMRRHIKIFHSDQKPYECKVCNKAYGIQQSFRYHMRDKHGITTVAKPVSKSKKANADIKD